MNTEIVIRGRVYSYTVETLPADAVLDAGKKQYNILGKRGAKYFTLRNQTNKDIMFICDRRSFGVASGMKGVWLTDKDNVLKVLTE